MARTKAYYSKKKILELINTGKVSITEQARATAKKDFGWDIDDICKALKSLQPLSWYSSEHRHNNPSIWVDYYRAVGLKGENVYTHFYIEDDCLIIDSFKEI